MIAPTKSASSRKAAPAPRRRRKEARPTELAEAALQVFSEKGYAATRLEDVATRAGVSKGTVYLYYASKEALFDGVIRKAVLPQVERSERRVEQHRGTAAELLRDTVADWLTTMRDTALGHIPKLLVTDADKFPELARVFHDSVVQRARQLIHRILMLGIRRSEFRIGDLDSTVELLVAAILTPAIQRGSPAFGNPRIPDTERQLTALMELTLHGISAMPASRRKNAKRP
jgi:AcrR family transcriptional regulator